MDIRFKIGSTKFNYRAVGILVEQNHVLLHKQWDEHHWSLPGGGVEIGEPADKAVVREIKEELGWDTKVKNLSWVVENFFQYNQENFHELGFYYILSSRGKHPMFGTDPFHGEEGQRLIYQWFPISELVSMHLQPPFLAEGLQNIPSVTQHLVQEDIEVKKL
ncbi:NUDIX domain-containing protein [Halobacillus shinanisalinarum]|uniref:NUDIX domain-containing protein n=1 Tax=Halobacillus shinanisalinarum TaxID=2932258 RepID=A0ABY4H5U6_9BACI|nr:NUDIX domain-containing protein [Halobacillus shinanisalinarum]UOQ95475.1 NUDIX domain-containing protein [Halobacillus shinanisalinarum]